MDDKAHTILGGVIASHGEKLTISNAFCNVYLTGYLADYPEEKRLLMALKVMDLPASLLAFDKLELSEAELIERIQQIAVGSDEKADDIAWGIDAWAEAIGVTEIMRYKIQQQCFSDTPQKINNTPPLLREIPAARLQPKSRHPVRLMTGVFGLMILQVFGNNHASDQSVLSKDLLPLLEVTALTPVKSVPKISPPDISMREVPQRKDPVSIKAPRESLSKIPPPSAVLQTVTNKLKHKPVQLDEPKLELKLEVKTQTANLVSEEYKRKSQRLLTETETFLLYGN